MRYCLDFYWQQGSACLMLGQASLPAALPPGNRRGTWRPGMLQPCQESPGWPRSVPSALPDLAQHRGAAHGREWPWKQPQLLEVTAPTAGRAALAAGDSHCCFQDCSSLQSSPGPALPCRAWGHCQPCASSSFSPVSAGSSQLLHCPNPELGLCHTSGRASTAGWFKTLHHHSQASFSGVERMGRTRGSCYKYKICYKEKTYIVHL